MIWIYNYLNWVWEWHMSYAFRKKNKYIKFLKKHFTFLLVMIDPLRIIIENSHKFSFCVWLSISLGIGSFLCKQNFKRLNFTVLAYRNSFISSTHERETITVCEISVSVNSKSVQI